MISSLLVLLLVTDAAAFTPLLRSLPLPDSTLLHLTKPHLPRGGGGTPPASTPSLLTKYNDVLTTSPVLTKSTTTAIVTAIGDIIAQHLEKSALAGFKLRRFFAFTITGGLFVGPTVHFWYNYLFGPIQTTLQNAPSPLIKRSKTLLLVLVDQTAGVLWFFPSYFLAFELAEALCYWRPIAFINVGRRLKYDLGAILLAQYKLWPLVNLFSFTFVPVKLRVLFSNVVSVAWNSYLCGAVGQ